MSTPGSVRSGDAASYTPTHHSGDGPRAPASRKSSFFRWKGIIPIALFVAVLCGSWLLFGARLIRSAIVEAGTKALGTQLDIASLRIGIFSTSMEMTGIAVADPFDRNRNLFEVRTVQVELEPRPLLEKKLIIRRITVADVRTSTRRSTPATAVTGPGFAPRALAEVQRFTKQFTVPVMSLLPIDTLKSLVLDPTQLKAVQAALSVGRAADSTKQQLETAYTTLRVQETIDSSAALIARLQTANVRSLGIDGARRALSDVRQATARIDSAKRRLDGLVATTKRGVDTLQAGLAAIDAARRDDYAFARGLLHLPSFDAPDIGAALFGRVTIDKFQQAVYWSTLARQYAPPGLLPRESPGPKRVRRAGTTIHFAKPQALPRFLLRRADVNVTISTGTGAGTYALAARDVTTDPAIVGRPTLFAVRRASGGSDVDSVRVTGMLDHATPRQRETVNVVAAGVRLPALAVPSLPFTMDPGKGSSELRFLLDGDQISGHWTVHSANVAWSPDSARARKLNSIESLVARVLTGVGQLDLSADISGTMAAPRLSVSSNLDRKVAEQLRSVVVQEIASAQAKVRAQVDKLVEEKSAPVKAKVAELRRQADQRVADARAKLDDERRKLEERVKALSGGLGGLIGL